MSTRRMMGRTFGLCATLALVLTQSCTLKHQELLRDRDAEIRRLRAELDQARARAGEFERSSVTAADTIRGLEAQLADFNARSDAPSGLDALAADLKGANVRVEDGQLKIGIENTISFASGSTTLKSSAHDLLSRVANRLKTNFDGRRIVVEGHTDTDPITKTKDRYRSNRHLSVERADAVATYLIDRCGVPSSRVVVVGYGPYDPLVRGSSDDAKAKNRRVEIVIGEPL